MVKRDVPKRVTLSNSRTFLPCYKWTARAHLHANIHLARPYIQRAMPKGKGWYPQAIAAPAAQQGQGIGDIFCFAKK